MKRAHALIISILLAATIAAGLFALARTTGSPTTAPASSTAGRQAQLDQWQASLEAALAERPPALPKLPARRKAPVAAPQQIAAAPVPGEGEREVEGHEGGEEE